MSCQIDLVIKYSFETCKSYYLSESVLEHQSQEFKNRKSWIGLKPSQMYTHKQSQEISESLHVTVTQFNSILLRLF